MPNALEVSVLSGAAALTVGAVYELAASHRPFLPLLMVGFSTLVVLNWAVQRRRRLRLESQAAAWSEAIERKRR